MYDHVLVGTDGSATATRAVESAARLADTHHARLTIAHAFDAKPTHDTNSAAVPDDLSWLLTPGTAADAIAQTAVRHAQAAARGALDIEVRTQIGTPRAVLRSLMIELNPDIVVVGNADARRSITRRGLGSALARRANVDVVIVDTSDPSDTHRGRRSAA